MIIAKPEIDCGVDFCHCAFRPNVVKDRLDCEKLAQSSDASYYILYHPNTLFRAMSESAFSIQKVEKPLGTDSLHFNTKASLAPHQYGAQPKVAGESQDLMGNRVVKGTNNIIRKPVCGRGRKTCGGRPWQPRPVPPQHPKVDMESNYYEEN